jgi:fluoride exporter
MGRFLLICLGGAAGTGARYLVSGWVLEALGPSFPYGTLAVNTIGSFLLAVVMYAGVEAARIPPTMRLVLGTGIMGGFTTYSTFSYETMKSIQDGAWAMAAANVFVTVLLCLAASFAGLAAARSMFGTY